MAKEINNLLSMGKVTQTGHRISYKTNMCGNSNSIFQKLHYELTEFLKEHGIKYMKKDFYIYHVEGDQHPRRGLITVSVESNDKTLPYSSDSIN